MKTLITDQLIYEYQKELETLKMNIHHLKFEGKFNLHLSNKMFLNKRLLEKFITRLQSLRQQEIDRICESFFDGKFYGNKKWKNEIDYFTQTFKQEGGKS